MKTYDIEQFLSDVVRALKPGFNTRLASITTEKGDGLTLKPIDDNAWFLQTLNEKVLNYDPFIFYGIEKPETQGLGPASATKWTVNVIVVLIEQTDLQIVSRLLRYQRAMTELLQESWDSIGGAVKIKLESMIPVAFKLVDSDENFRAIGVSLDVTIV